MPRYIFDIETDGLLDELTTVHSLVLKDLDTGETLSCARDRDGEEPGGEYWAIAVGLNRLAKADLIVGHNIIKFDIPAIQKVSPGWFTEATIRDTLLLSRLIYPEIKQGDVARHKKGKLPGKLIGRYSLEAWGHRLGEYKGDFKGPWTAWSPEMQEYCQRDVEVTAILWERLSSLGYSERAVDMEHEFQKIMFRMEREGFPFDEQAAVKLYSTLRKRSLELQSELQETFPAWWRNRGEFAPRRDNRRRGYTNGAPLTRIELADFNPGSRDDIADRLIKLRRWKPTEFSAEGKPKVDEATLARLPWPEAKLIVEYLMVQKRIGQLAEGNQAWLKQVKLDGKIHGTITTIGAVTRRCTHSHPNISQVPAVRAPWGKECRSLYIAPPGFKMVGADASGIELRCLAHYMAKYDGGAYTSLLLEGDVHTANQEAAGLETRDQAKTMIYALLYGAGDPKLGQIVGKGKKAGRQAGSYANASWRTPLHSTACARMSMRRSPNVDIFSPSTAANSVSVTSTRRSTRSSNRRGPSPSS